MDCDEFRSKRERQQIDLLPFDRFYSENLNSCAYYFIVFVSILGGATHICTRKKILIRNVCRLFWTFRFLYKVRDVLSYCTC